VEFRLLGPVQLIDQGLPVPIEGTKTRALLAVLLIHANSVVSTSRLAEHLWGDNPPATAVGSLHAYVSRLRRLTGAGVLLTRRPGYQLKLDPDQLDVTRFERLLKQGMADVRSGRPRQAVAALREALALWQGPCLAEFADEPFAADEITRMEGLRTAAIEECLGAELALGRHAEVVEELHGLVLEHPTREAFWSHLMLALYRCDRQAEALATYHAARTRMSDELGIEPGPALRALHHSILNQDPSLAWTPPNPLPAVLARATGRSLVGRATEAGWLRDAWCRTRAGAPSVVFLTGEAGIGKTRLAMDLTMDAHRDGGTVLWGRALRNNLAPYEPFAEALRDYTERFTAADVVRRIGPAATDLGLLVPGMPDASAPTQVPKARRHRMFEAVAELLRTAAAEAPVLLILDDLHAADRSTLLLAEHLIRHPRPPACMILVLYRETDLTAEHPLAALLSALRADGLAEHRRLAGLGARDVERLVQSITGTVPSPALVRAVHERTAGNPLFVDEIVRSLLASGADPETAVRQLAVPERIRDVIAQRLAGLPAPARRVLGAASAIGHQFTLDVLAALLEQAEHVLSEVLEQGVEAGIVREQGGGPGRYVFSHPLIHDTLYEGLTNTRRASLHERAGEILERLGDGGARASLGELAHHFHQSAINDAQRAVDYALRAGDEAMALLGFAEARTHYERAHDLLGLADPAARGNRRGRLLLALGYARLGEYDVTGARRVFLDAAQVALERSASEELARAVMGLVWGIEFADWDPKAVTQLEEALSRLEATDDPLRAKLLASLARALPAGDSRVTHLGDESVAIARRLGDPDTLAFVLSTTLLARWGPENSAERLAVANETLRLGTELGWVEVSMQSLNWRSVAMEERGDLAATEADLTALAELAEQAGRPFYAATTAMRRGSRALAEGRYDEAARLVETMFANGRDSRNFQAAYGLQTLHRYRDLGRLAEVADQVTASIESRPDVPAWRSGYALLQLELGNHDIAAAELAELMSDNAKALPRDWLWIGAIGHLAEVCAGLRDVEHAPALLRMLQDYAWCNIVVANGVLSLGATARILGLLCTNLDRFDEAEEHFGTAIEVNTRWRARPSLVRTRLGYAELLRRRGHGGDHGHAERLIAAATADAARLGMAVPGGR